MSKSIKILKTQTGFSLIELLIVISILAIVTSIAAPNITNIMANQAMKSDATAIASLLQQAKIESAIKRKTTRVVFTAAAGSTPASVELTYITKKNNIETTHIITSHTLKDSVKFTISPATSSSIDFLASGRVNVADTSLTLCSDSIDNEVPRVVKISTNTRISYSKTGSCS